MNRIDWQLTCTDLDQRADDETLHVEEEAVSSESDDDFGIGLLDAGFCHLLKGIFGLRICGKYRKVVFTDEVDGSIFHGICVEFLV